MSGETLILCKRNILIAEIRSLPKPRTLPRPIGLAADRGVELPPKFFGLQPNTRSAWRALPPQ